MAKKAEEKKLKERRARAARIVRILKKLFPQARIMLKHRNDWELLVAVMLSAQCTDKKVNEVTAVLFKKYRTLDDYIKANPREFEKYIKPTGFYRNKAKNILAAAKILKDKYKGKMPATMGELLILPGVARKTANVILGNVYGIVEGIAVDTHVKRFARKFDLTDSKNPDKIEKDLMRLLPKKEWLGFTYKLIEYGRRICPARKHDCRDHPLTKLYPPAAGHWPAAK
jgi:endonuclease-3